jgi:hypothetical protein
MNRLRGTRSLVTVAALLLLPCVALAEVSVQLDGRGHYKRYWYLTSGRGRTAIVWKQVRPRLPHNVLLNPLGDNLGDLAPAIQTSPATGYPWVVWPKNFGNIKQLVYSTWDDKNKQFTEPALVAPGVPLVYDDLAPSFAVDQTGALYLVWWRAEQTPKIYFSTFILGRWTPAQQISDASVDSRAPSIALDGSWATITYRTPSGLVTKQVQTAILIDSPASLMDNPIPPLYGPPPPPAGNEPSGGGGSAGGSLIRN